MSNIWDYVKDRLTEADLAGIILFAFAIIIVFCAKPLAHLFEKREEKQEQAVLILKFFGLAVTVLSFLFLTKII